MVVPCLRSTPRRMPSFAAKPKGVWPVTLAHPRTRATRGDGSPAPRMAGLCSWREEGLPGAWVVLLARAAANYPAGCAPRSPMNDTARRGLQTVILPGHPGYLHFRGWTAAAHHLAYLRIVGLVTSPAARLATDLVGLDPDRAGFAPAGRRIRISEAYRYLLPFETSLAWSHITSEVTLSAWAATRKGRK